MSNNKEKHQENQDTSFSREEQELNDKHFQESEDETAPEDLDAYQALTDEDIKSLCQENICPDCELLQEQKSRALKAIADSENYKKRITREKEEYCKYAISSFIEELIPVIDNLELALEHGKKNEACKDLVQGVEMTMDILHQVLAKNNLQQVGEVGQPFDPNYHEAMAQQERADLDPDTVCQVMQKGYLLQDRLVRPAKVLVSKPPSEKNN